MFLNNPSGRLDNLVHSENRYDAEIDSKFLNNPSGIEEISLHCMKKPSNAVILGFLENNLLGILDSLWHSLNNSCAEFKEGK